MPFHAVFPQVNWSNGVRAVSAWMSVCCKRPSFVWRNVASHRLISRLLLRKRWPVRFVLVAEAWRHGGILRQGGRHECARLVFEMLSVCQVLTLKNDNLSWKNLFCSAIFHIFAKTNYRLSYVIIKVADGQCNIYFKLNNLKTKLLWRNYLL